VLQLQIGTGQELNLSLTKSEITGFLLPMTVSDFGLSRRYMILGLTALTFQIYEKHNNFGDSSCAGWMLLFRQAV
jgi:hypothetical protein